MDEEKKKEQILEIIKFLIGGIFSSFEKKTLIVYFRAPIDFSRERFELNRFKSWRGQGTRSKVGLKVA